MTEAILTIAQRYAAIVRNALGMDMVWVAEHSGGQQVIRAVDGAAAPFGVSPGDSLPLEGSFCVRVLDGRLPALIPDVRMNASAASLPVTDRLGVGAYAGAPVSLPGGRIFGMLCGFDRGAHPELATRDLRVLEALADAMAEEIAVHVADAEAGHQVRARIQRAVDGAGFAVVVQPIVGGGDSRIVGVEALVRFDDPPASPDRWFADAAVHGLDAALELAVVREAVKLLETLPAPVYLSLNLSPGALCEPQLVDVLSALPADRIVLELTEHASVAEYDALLHCTQVLRSRGVRLAVDDAGAGYASFRHILALRPDIMKIDRALIAGIDSDPAREALVHALVMLGSHIGASVVAEGVETEHELATVRRLGVTAVQGYLLGRPAPLPSFGASWTAGSPSM